MIAYQSIFQERSRPVTSTDFEEAPTLKGDSVEDVAKWNDGVPFLPQDIFSLFKSAFGEGARLKVILDGGLINPVSFHAVDNNTVEFARLEFQEGVKEKPWSQIKVSDTHQGQGLGKKWFGFMNELCLIFGHKKIEFEAGLTNGGYTWARAGAHIDLSPTKHTALTHQREKILARVEAIKPFIPAVVYHRARALGRVVAKDDLKRIADIDYCLLNELCQHMEAWDSPFLDSLSAAFNRCGIDVQHKEQRYAEQCVMAARVQGVPLKIGRYLLSGTTWDAVVDYADVEQMKSIDNYVGGWKTIRPIVKKTPVITPAFIHS